MDAFQPIFELVQYAEKNLFAAEASGDEDRVKDAKHLKRLVRQVTDSLSVIEEEDIDDEDLPDEDDEEF